LLLHRLSEWRITAANCWRSVAEKWWCIYVRKLTLTDGPYRFIRHPRYLGGVIQGIGLSLLFRSWIGLALTSVFLFIVLFRIQDEEALMREAFGAAWAQYCKKSWRLVPFLY